MAWLPLSSGLHHRLPSVSGSRHEGATIIMPSPLAARWNLRQREHPYRTGVGMGPGRTWKKPGVSHPQ